MLRIKEPLAKFYHLVFDTATHFKCNCHYTLIAVLLQNAAFDGGDSPDEKYAEILRIEDILQQFANYYSSYFERWVYEEVHMIIQGILLSELEEMPELEE